MENGEQLHHIMFYRKLHEATPEHKAFRTRQLGLTAIMLANEHRALHADVTGVPPLDVFMVRRVLNNYEPAYNVLESMDNYMLAVEQAMRHPKTHSIERQLASLAIHAVDLQKPYIRAGLVDGGNLPRRRT